NQLCRTSRFGDVVVGTGIQCAHDVALAVALGQENRGNWPVQVSPDAFQHFDAGHVGYLPVEYDQVVATVQHGPQKRLAGSETVAVVSFLGQNGTDVLRLFEFIFQQSNAHVAWPSIVLPGSDCRCAERSENEVTLQRSEEHTSELQSRENLVCRLLLEKKN